MLTNALPKLVNLRNFHISSPAEDLPPILHILQSANPRLCGLSLQYVDNRVQASNNINMNS